MYQSAPFDLDISVSVSVNIKLLRPLLSENSCISGLVELMLEWDEGGGVDYFLGMLISDSIVRAQDKKWDYQVRIAENTYWKNTFLGASM